MADDPESLTLRYLRRLDEKMDRVMDELPDLKLEVRGIKSHQSGFMQNDLAQDSGIAALRDRVARIERRLDLQEPQT